MANLQGRLRLWQDAPRRRHRHQREDEGDTVFFSIVPDLLDHLRAAFAPTSELTYDALFERVRESGLLVLDDLGAENGTAWATEKLFQLINYRYNYRMPTVITTNARLMSLMHWVSESSVTMTSFHTMRRSSSFDTTRPALRIR